MAFPRMRIVFAVWVCPFLWWPNLSSRGSSKCDSFYPPLFLLLQFKLSSILNVVHPCYHIVPEFVFWSEVGEYCRTSGEHWLFCIRRTLNLNFPYSKLPHINAAASPADRDTFPIQMPELSSQVIYSIRLLPSRQLLDRYSPPPLHTTQLFFALPSISISIEEFKGRDSNTQRNSTQLEVTPLTQHLFRFADTSKWYVLLYLCTSHSISQSQSPNLTFSIV